MPAYLQVNSLELRLWFKNTFGRQIRTLSLTNVFSTINEPTWVITYVGKKLYICMESHSLYRLYICKNCNETFFAFSLSAKHSVTEVWIALETDLSFLA